MKLYSSELERCNVGNCFCTGKHWVGYEGEVYKMCELHYSMFKEVMFDKMLNEPEEENDDKMETEESAPRDPSILYERA